MNKTIINLSLLALVVTSLGACVYLYASRTRTAYIDIAKVYAGFTYKKELEQKFTQIQTRKKEQLDSLRIKVQILTNSSRNAQQEELLKQLNEEYRLKESRFEQENSQLSADYTSQIFKQLNQYVQDYGKENGYDYILGSDGSGTLMYANAKEEITATVITYINNRYNGK